MRKLPGSVGGLNAKQDMLSSGGDVTSISYEGQETTFENCELSSYYFYKMSKYVPL